MIYEMETIIKAICWDCIKNSSAKHVIRWKIFEPNHLVQNIYSAQWAFITPFFHIIENHVETSMKNFQVDWAPLVKVCEGAGVNKNSRQCEIFKLIISRIQKVGCIIALKLRNLFFIMTNKNINGKIEPQKSFGNFFYGPITWSFFCLLRHLRLVRIRNIRFQKMHIPHHASKQKGQSFKFRVMNNNSIIREASKKFLFQPLIIILKHFLLHQK